MKWYSIQHAIQFLGDLLGENALRELIKEKHIKALASNRGKGTTPTLIYKIAESELKRFSQTLETADSPIAFKNSAGDIIVEFIPTIRKSA